MIKLQCWKCSNDIYRKPSKIAQSRTKRFVCSDCYSKGRGDYIKCKKDGCDTTFYVHPCEATGIRTKLYCSQPCAKSAQSQATHGSRSKGGQGYIKVNLPSHPNANKNGRVAEHTLVMSEFLGRPLLPKEEVHHKNGVRDDNRLSNLELWSTSQPPGQRVEDKVDFALEILRLYAPQYLNDNE